MPTQIQQHLSGKWIRTSSLQSLKNTKSKATRLNELEFYFDLFICALPKGFQCSQYSQGFRTSAVSIAKTTHQLIYINKHQDMSGAFAQIFGKIPRSELDMALHCGLLLGSAASIFYLFFGRLLSIPELLSNTLKDPTSNKSRNSFIIISGFIFFSAITRTFYHEHISASFPFDDEVYLQKISTLRLIISGALVGFGSQLALQGRQDSGVMGVPTFSLSSFVSVVSLFGSAMLTVTYKLGEALPKTPRVIEIANRSLPKNISFDSYLLVTLLVPFICFLISEKKSLKGLIESLTNFVIGIIVANFLMLIGWSNIQKTYSRFTFSKSWTGEMIVAFVIASLVFGFVFMLVKYGFKKPLFYNQLQDKKYKFSMRSIIGHAVVGLGFGLGGLFFHSFLLTVPSSEIRIAVFWGLPCIFAMKATQVISQTSELPAPSEEKKQ